MENKNSGYSILEYLKKKGATNTFKLAHVLGIKRDKLLRILKNLEEEELVKIILGKVEFLSYPLPREKKKQKPKVSKEKSEAQLLQEEAEKQKLYIKKLKKEIKKLEQRPSKVITRTIIKEAKPEPIKIKRKKKKKEEKIKEAETKLKKIVKRGVNLRKRFKKGFGIKKSFKKLGLKIKGGFGIFKIKNFIKDLKKKKRG